MPESSATAEYQALLSAIEPAARVVPRRALRRAIRQSRDQGTFRPHAVHDLAWWVSRDQLFQWLTPSELGLTNHEPPELLLVPEPETPPSHQAVWRQLFHAELDREVDVARWDGRLTDQTIRQHKHDLGPVRWQMIRTVLVEENLIDDSDSDDQALREFIVYGLEIHRFSPGEWGTFFPGLSVEGDLLRTVRGVIDVNAVSERTRPPVFSDDLGPGGQVGSVRTQPRSTSELIPDVTHWVARGNDLKAAVLLERAGDPRGTEHLEHLIDRVARVIDLDDEGRGEWSIALGPLLGPAARGGWPVERRLLYELQRACLALERTNFTADLIDWLRTFGRRRLKRPLPKTRWVEAHRRFRAGLQYAERLPGAHRDPRLEELLVHVSHVTEARARDDLRPALVEVLDEVGLVPKSVPEERSREKLVEELLDGAVTRGFFRIGDLRDAIARNRVKLPDLRGPGELVRGDSLIRANELLPDRLDGVYRRGEVYMRLLQRGCSVFFGTRPGRWFSKYIALPFGGAFILLEALGHLKEAAVGAVNWLSGWTATVQGLGLLGGGAATTLADNPTLQHGGVSAWNVFGVGLFLLLLLHWPAFRARVISAAKFAFVSVPRAIRRSPFVHRLVHNKLTRFFRRHLLVPVVAAALGAMGTWLVGGGATSIALVAVGTAALAASFFRTPIGREVEDRFDEAMERVWRIVSVNFVLGLLSLILGFFQAVFERIDRGIHAVDEALRFREGQGRLVFAVKLAFGTVWSVVTYLFRFAWTLLVEPQINPIKHFPVVTVSHKVLLPLIPPLSKQLGVSPETMTTIVFGIPGVFGFLAWELKENWKLYAANAPSTFRPVQVGSHGETVRRLLRPGFHSGTVPKAYAKFRGAVRGGDKGRTVKQRHTLEHIGDSVHHFADRCFVTYLRASSRWGALSIAIGHPELAPNRIVLPVEIAGRPRATAFAFEERNGWVIACVEDYGGLANVSWESRAAFADALMGLYKQAGVDLVREQVAAVFGAQAYQFDTTQEGLLIVLPDGKEQLFDYEDGPEIGPVERRLPSSAIVLSDSPLPWADWVRRWEADAAGQAPPDPIIPGWTVLRQSSSD